MSRLRQNCMSSASLRPIESDTKPISQTLLCRRGTRFGASGHSQRLFRSNAQVRPMTKAVLSLTMRSATLPSPRHCFDSAYCLDCRTNRTFVHLIKPSNRQQEVPEDSLTDHPVVSQSFATFPPMSSMGFTDLISEEVINENGVTVKDVST